MTPDSELLAVFARTNSEDAFTKLVKRHVNLVYSAALRQLNGDEHLAQDVAQSVFTDLARKADVLKRRESLIGWLYTSAHFAAAKIVRTEIRRRDREEIFMRDPNLEAAPELDWEKLHPVLDDAMHELKEADRDAILLRYFENRPFAEMGAQLGLSENAARMRVERAVEKLRMILAQRGLTAGATLATVISANAVQLAPASLVATLTAASLLTTGTGTITLLKIMTLTKLKIAASTLVVAGTATAFVLQHQAQEKLRSDNATLSQQLSQFRTDNESLSNRLTMAGDAPKFSDAQYNELMQLRGEVDVLRKQIGGFKKAQLELAQKEKEMGRALAASQSEIVRAMAKAKFKADEIRVVNNVKQICLAFHIVAGDHNGQFPTNLNEEVLLALGSTNLMAYAQTEIELVNQSIPNQNSHPGMIQMRERAPRQDPDGKWKRIYGLVDGSVQTATSDDGNFDAWEKQNTELPPAIQ